VRTLIVILIAAFAGYYIYQETFVAGGDAPSCKQVYEACSTKCRKTETESASYTACLQKCQGALDACK
jgi:hypothetical protein